MAWEERKKRKSICFLIINPGQDGMKQLAVMNGIFRELLGSDPKHPRVNDEQPCAQLVDALSLVIQTALDQALGEMVEDAPESSSFLPSVLSTGLEIAQANFGCKIGACCTEAGFGSSFLQSRASSRQTAGGDHCSAQGL